jgi:cytochrome c
LVVENKAGVYVGFIFPVGRVLKPEDILKKQVMFSVLCASLLVACGSKEEKPPVQAVPMPQSAVPAVTKSAPDENMAATDGMPVLARKYNCTACHAIDKKVVGPAWMDVSKKYKGQDVEAKLIAKVSKGGSGSWGSMPMPPNDQAGIKQEDMKELVKFILALAK